ncbi:MAG TPA: crotonase/enoyl-CoA hydratase family protein [Acidimicrobiales bacterium]|nr:crotonase/enoyl-CoA hydratase family protein [Acidimicrobiales bacterium]
MPVQLDRDGHVAVVVMDRPEARNAMDADLTAALDDTYDALAADDDIWAVVLTGAGDRAFCAGRDLKQVVGGGTRGAPAARRRGGFGGITTRDFPKPLIAAVNGYALGGGLEIVLSCDLAVAEEHAQLGLPEVRRGVVAAAGGLVRIGRRLPMPLALELALTGEPVSARRAYELGLVNRVVPSGEGVAAAVALAQKVCEASPVAVRLSKQMVRRCVGQGEDELWDRQRELMAVLASSEDFREGPLAFVEKRSPRWTGR